MSDGTDLRVEFLLDPSVTFLNHGSFGACPREVFERYQQWQLELERQPVLFLARQLEELLPEARAALGAYIGADPDDLVFVPNATAGVNVAAWAVGLEAGDEVLSTNLEYGALDLTWEYVCGQLGARYVRTPMRLRAPTRSSRRSGRESGHDRGCSLAIAISGSSISEERPDLSPRRVSLAAEAVAAGKLRPGPLKAPSCAA